MGMRTGSDTLISFFPPDGKQQRQGEPLPAVNRNKDFWAPFRALSLLRFIATGTPRSRSSLRGAGSPHGFYQLVPHHRLPLRELGAAARQTLACRSRQKGRKQAAGHTAPASH